REWGGGTRPNRSGRDLTRTVRPVEDAAHEQHDDHRDRDEQRGPAAGQPGRVTARTPARAEVAGPAATAEARLGHGTSPIEVAGVTRHGPRPPRPWSVSGDRPARDRTG